MHLLQDLIHLDLECNQGKEKRENAFLWMLSLCEEALYVNYLISLTSWLYTVESHFSDKENEDRKYKLLPHVIQMLRTMVIILAKQL